MCVIFSNVEGVDEVLEEFFVFFKVFRVLKIDVFGVV